MIKYIKTLFSRKRIIKIGDKFVPQVLDFRLGVSWAGVDRNGIDCWTLKSNIIKYCAVNSIQIANENIYRYLAHIEKLKQQKQALSINKVYEVYEVDPEIWVKLKQKEKNN